MKIPTKLKDYEISFLKNRGLFVTFDKYPNQTEFNKSIIIYAYIPLFGLFLLDEEENKQYKLTSNDIPDFFKKDIANSWFESDPSLKD
mgnify:CR=1 FL=1